MFRCQLCQCVVPPRTPAQHLVLKRRGKDYPHRSRANMFIRTNAEGKRKEYHTDDPGGEGQEVVKEVIVCPVCAAQHGERGGGATLAVAERQGTLLQTAVQPRG